MKGALSFFYPDTNLLIIGEVVETEKQNLLTYFRICNMILGKKL